MSARKKKTPGPAVETYVGSTRCCGAWRACIVDDPREASSTAVIVAAWIRRGLIIQRVTAQQVRARGLDRCSCRPETPENPQLALPGEPL